MSLEEYWKRLDEMPEELREIVTDNYDYTGRPTSMRSHSNVVIGVLNKNAAEGWESFRKDMEIVCPQMHSEEVAVYYNVFTAGAKYIADRVA